MLDPPVRIFRCSICIENGFNAPKQDLSLLIEHLAKHYQFYLYECQNCKERFATPFLANFHIKEGRCQREDGELRADDKKPLIAVNLDDIEFSSFCILQNAITKCTQEMLLEQTALASNKVEKEDPEAGSELKLSAVKNRNPSASLQSPSSPVSLEAADEQAPCCSKARPKFGSFYRSIQNKNNFQKVRARSSLGSSQGESSSQFPPGDSGIGLALKSRIAGIFGEPPSRRYFRRPVKTPYVYRRSPFQKEVREPRI